MEIDSIALEQALEALGHLLADRGYYYEGVAIGGGSLLLMNHLDRTTKDLDLVALVDHEKFVTANPLPLELLQAIEDVGSALAIGKEWLNSGPSSLLDMGLPEGFSFRMQSRSYGGLKIHFAGKFDQICFKLYAAVDQGPQSKHFADLKFLNPTIEELKIAKEWCLTHDNSEIFITELNYAITALGAQDAIS
jgi:hypothetical protein